MKPLRNWDINWKGFWTTFIIGAIMLGIAFYCFQTLGFFSPASRIAIIAYASIVLVWLNAIWIFSMPSTDYRSGLWNKVNHPIKNGAELKIGKTYWLNGQDKIMYRGMAATNGDFRFSHFSSGNFDKSEYAVSFTPKEVRTYISTQQEVFDK